MTDRRIDAVLDAVVGDLEDARKALRSNKVRVALAKMELIAARLREASKELRA